MKTRSIVLSTRIKELLRRWLRGDDAGTHAPTDWTRHRAPIGERDRVLLHATHVWLRRIPSGVHPKHLCRDHPHIANRFAQCWGDSAQVEQLVRELTSDQRGQRRGFSQRVVMEIERLKFFHAHALRASFHPPQMQADARVSMGSRGGPRPTWVTRSPANQGEVRLPSGE
jgi:hypothetical protein